MEPLKDDNSVSYIRWVTAHILTMEFFKNTITLQLVTVYCVLMLLEMKPPNEFTVLVSMAVGFYFKAARDKEK